MLHFFLLNATAISFKDILITIVLIAALALTFLPILYVVEKATNFASDEILEDVEKEEENKNTKQ